MRLPPSAMVVLLAAAAATCQRQQQHADLLARFSAAITPRTWDEAYALAKPFVARLSTAEKISLTTGTGIALGPCSGNVPGVERLGFRHLCLQDGPAGLRGVDLVTLFPAGITVAATWDRELLYLRARAMGVENRLKGVNVALAPVAGALGRAPAAGRGWESFGADPWLNGVGNRESVRGLQDEGVIACAKHWVANEQEKYRLVFETFLYGLVWKSLDSRVTQRALREVYEWPFADAIEAGAGSVMCSYQRVNGDYACESATIIAGHLKGNSSVGGLGFRGFVVTDWFASAAPDLASAAGVDMVMPGDLGMTGAAAVGKRASAGFNGTRLDEMVLRTVAAWFKMRQDEGHLNNISFSSWFPDAEFGSLLDRGYVGQINFHVPANPPLHADIARRIAAEGTVLLKNTDGALPLGPEIRRVGVFGNSAGPIAGDCGSFGACVEGTLAVGWGSGSGLLDHVVDPLAAITQHVSGFAGEVTAVLDDYDYAGIRAAAGGQDVCLAFVSSRSGEGTNSVAGNLGDRNNLTAWHDGDTLVRTVAGSCRNTVVVIHSVGAILMEAWIAHPNVTAVVLAHLPGQESGGALVDVLWGAVNPSGKLPYTVARREADYCCRVQYAWTGFLPVQDFAESLLVDYRWFDARAIEPRFEFGFGLSYTTFTYAAGLAVAPQTRPLAQTPFAETVVAVTATLTNSGDVPGKEVVQLYLSLPPAAPAGTPLRQLRGFEKVLLRPGESVEVTFELTKRDLSYWDEPAAQWRALPGSYGIFVGASSRMLLATASVVIL